MNDTLELTLLMNDTLELTSLQRDALYKAAESIKEGMWCRSIWFGDTLRDDWEGSSEGFVPRVEDLFDPYSPWNRQDYEDALTVARRSYRCAEGEIALQIALAGGDARDYSHVNEVVSWYLGKTCEKHLEDNRVAAEVIANHELFAVAEGGMNYHSLSAHNDVCINDGETAPLVLSELFRTVADTH